MNSKDNSACGTAMLKWNKMLTIANEFTINTNVEGTGNNKVIIKILFKFL